MEAVFILALIVFVGFIVYNSLPRTKYRKAEKLIEAKNYLGAIVILDAIFDSCPDAPSSLADCKLQLAMLASDTSIKKGLLNEVIDIGKRIQNKEKVRGYEKIEAKAYLEIAKIQYKEAGKDINKLERNVIFIDDSNKTGHVKEFALLKMSHFSDLSKVYFKNGIKCEKNDQLKKAISEYTCALDYAERSNGGDLAGSAMGRKFICYLKRKERVELKDVLSVQISDAKLKNELYYRYCIGLLKAGEFVEADSFFRRYITFSSPDVEKVKEVIYANKVNEAIAIISLLNERIESMYSESMSIEEIQDLHRSLGNAIEILEEVSAEDAIKVSEIKNTLFSRILAKNIGDGHYMDAIALIETSPQFWNNIDLLKNYGICAFGIASRGALSKENYKIVISAWLTAVYSDKVVLKSLEGTNWDDEYTFTLCDAIGSTYRQYDTIPDNVNYEAVTDTNISIGATQRELLSQFESLIYKEIDDVTIIDQVRDFYEKEKTAIERVIQVLEADITVTSPFFAIRFGIEQDVIEEMDRDFKTYLNEESLEAGIPYLGNSSSSIVYQYYYANDLVGKIKIAIRNENKKEIRKLNTKENILWINRFEKVKDNLEGELFASIAERMQNSPKSEGLISLMEECLTFCENGDKLKHQYSSYVSMYCVEKVNSKEINHYEALSLMRKAYLYSPGNLKVCKNIVTLISLNLMDILNEKTRNTSDIYKVLDFIKDNKSSTFLQSCGELREDRKMLLKQLGNAGVDVRLFEDSSSQSSLNEHGKRMKKVLHYMKTLSS